MKNIKIFSCPTAESFTQEVCDNIKIKMGKIKYQKFSNDNNFVQVLETVRGQDVYVVQTTKPPVNERVMELLITIDALKRASSKTINVVLPYYIYSRSDKKDQPRVPVTAKLIAQLIEAAGADRIITCDLHNPAIQAYFTINCDRLSAQNLLQSYFKEKNLEDMVIVANVKDKNAIIFDDEVDTAGSMIETARILEKFHAKNIYAGCTHGILSGPAIERIKNSPIKELVITNTVPLTKEKQIDKIKVLSIAPLFAQAILRIHQNKPLGELLKIY